MADAEDSKSSVRKDMGVQVPPSAPGFAPTVVRFPREGLWLSSPRRGNRERLWLNLRCSAAYGRFFSLWYLKLDPSSITW